MLINIDSTTIDNLQYSNTNNNNAIIHARTGNKMLLKCFLRYTHTFDIMKLTPFKMIGIRSVKKNLMNFLVTQSASFLHHSNLHLHCLQKVSAPTLTINHSRILLKCFVSGLIETLLCSPLKKKISITISGIYPSKLRLQPKRFQTSWMTVMFPLYTIQYCFFQEKQNYLYAVLESRVLTDCSKAFIQDDEHDYDAQKYTKIFRPFIYYQPKPRWNHP
jgi:hypothetical protein